MGNKLSQAVEPAEDVSEHKLRFFHTLSQDEVIAVGGARARPSFPSSRKSDLYYRDTFFATPQGSVEVIANGRSFHVSENFMLRFFSAEQFSDIERSRPVTVDRSIADSTKNRERNTNDVKQLIEQGPSRGSSRSRCEEWSSWRANLLESMYDAENEAKISVLPIAECLEASCSDGYTCSKCQACKNERPCWQRIPLHSAARLADALTTQASSPSYLESKMRELERAATSQSTLENMLKSSDAEYSRLRTETEFQRRSEQLLSIPNSALVSNRTLANSVQSEAAFLAGTKRQIQSSLQEATNLLKQATQAQKEWEKQVNSISGAIADQLNQSAKLCEESAQEEVEFLNNLAVEVESFRGIASASSKRLEAALSLLAPAAQQFEALQVEAEGAVGHMQRAAQIASSLFNQRVGVRKKLDNSISQQMVICEVVQSLQGRVESEYVQVLRSEIEYLQKTRDSEAIGIERLQTGFINSVVSRRESLKLKLGQTSLDQLCFEELAYVLLDCGVQPKYVDSFIDQDFSGPVASSLLNSAAAAADRVFELEDALEANLGISDMLDRKRIAHILNVLNNRMDVFAFIPGKDDSKSLIRGHCPLGHKLERVPHISVSWSWTCDNLNCDTGGRGYRWQCKSCDFDLCQVCYREVGDLPETGPHYVWSTTKLQLILKSNGLERLCPKLERVSGEILPLLTKRKDLNSLGITNIAEQQEFLGFIRRVTEGASAATGLRHAKAAGLDAEPRNDVAQVPVLSWLDIKAGCDSFAAMSIIGEGAFGKVYRGRLQLGPAARLGGPQQVCAVKRLDVEGDQGDEEFLRELEVLALCKHPNLVPLLAVAMQGKERCLVYPLMAGGNLLQRLASPKPFQWQQRTRVATHVLQGILYLHSQVSGKSTVLHRDIKAENVLLDQYDTARIADVGLARLLDSHEGRRHVSTKNLVGTFGYICPVYASQGRYYESSDGYSVGVVLLQLLTGRPAVNPDPSVRPQDLATSMRRAKAKGAAALADPRAGAWNARVSLGLAEVGVSLIQSDEEERMTLQDALAQIENLIARVRERSSPFSIAQDFAAQSERVEPRECVICMVGDRAARFAPCGHMLTCKPCAQVVISQLRVCPLCNVAIARFTKALATEATFKMPR